MTGRNVSVNRVGAMILLCGLAALAGQGAGGSTQTPAPDAKNDPEEKPTAESVLRKSAAYYRAAKSIAVVLERVQTIGDFTTSDSYTVAFQRPNRFAIGAKKGEASVTLVSDGKTLFTSIAALRMFTEAKAPASFDALVSDPIVQASLQGMIFDSLFADHPYEKLMEGVKTAKYAGQEKLDGAEAHHLTFTQDQLDWEMWVAVEGDPLVRRVVLDLSKLLANTPGAGQLKGRKMQYTDDYKDWRIDQALDEKAFVFQTPKGWQKVESLLEGLRGGREAPSPLLGEAAPEVDLKLLGEGAFRLKEQRDGHVVMLDFWATWCGPCVMELPILAEVAKSYKDKGVVFCAVNEQEKPEEIRKFLKEKGLEFSVALDSDGKVGQAYHAEAIPLLVLIDKTGVVQSVHVGYDPAIKAKLTKELDALLAGKNLAKESLDAEKAAKPAAKSEGMEQAWSVGGGYASVATDPKGRVIYAVAREGRCDVLDGAGKTTRTFRLADNQHTIARVARLAGGVEGLLAFNPWGGSVLACKGDGTTLWEEAGGDGIDDVWAADLDGDGFDEAIVGYNGSTGLHVFSHEGKRLWKRSDLGNVWHVTASDLDGDGKLEVVTTSARGQVHVFSRSDGEPLRTLDAGLYANMVRSAPGRPDLAVKGDLVLVIGQGASGEAMVALDGKGKSLWTLQLPADTQHCDSLAVSPDGNWAAAGLRGGQVCVVDIPSGRIVAQVPSQGLTPIVAWADAGPASTPLLLVATGREVSAFRIKPVAAPAQEAKP